LKREAAHAPIPVINHNSLLQLQTGSSGQGHDFIMREDMAAGADHGSVQVPFCAHVALAFAAQETIMNPSGGGGQSAVGAQIIAMVYVQKEFAVL